MVSFITTFFIIFMVVLMSIYMVGIIITIFSKNAKKISKTANDITKESTNAFEKMKESLSNEVQCHYCKTTYSKTEKKCPSCGASKPRK